MSDKTRTVVELVIETDKGAFTTEQIIEGVEKAITLSIGSTTFPIVAKSGHVIDRRAKRVILAQFPSESDPSKEPYKVCERTDDTLYCDCPGYLWNRSCWHIDLMKVRQATKK